MQDQSVGSAEVRVRHVLHVETVLDHPVEKVWPYLVYWEPWIAGYVIGSGSGKVDQEGETFDVRHFDEAGRIDESFTMKVIRFAPYQQFVLERVSPHTSYDKDGDPTVLRFTGYDINGIFDVGGKSLITTDVIGDKWHPGITPEEAEAMAAEFTKGAVEAWEGKYFPALRKLLAEA